MSATQVRAQGRAIWLSDVHCEDAADVQNAASNLRMARAFIGDETATPQQLRWIARRLADSVDALLTVAEGSVQE